MSISRIQNDLENERRWAEEAKATKALDLLARAHALLSETKYATLTKEIGDFLWPSERHGEEHNGGR